MNEYHVILRGRSVPEVLEAERRFAARYPERRFLLKRWLLSDVDSQSGELPAVDGAVSVIGQAPLDGSRAALWIWMAEGVEVEYRPGLTIARADGLEHYFSAGMTSDGVDSESQTSGILDSYETFLQENGMTIEANCFRTWFFCNDIDNNYAGLVKARRENFDLNGLTAQTHYISSTGIAGVPAGGRTVQMDAWAIKGDVRHKYLRARTHLNHTSEYGVTFERGVRLDYSGHRHCIISGTASINNRGEVLHVGDVKAQTQRMLENVRALLKEGESRSEDICSALVYIRNESDAAAVDSVLSSSLAGKPYIILLAPVCRPAWLVEMECISISKDSCSSSSNPQREERCRER